MTIAIDHCFQWNKVKTCYNVENFFGVKLVVYADLLRIKFDKLFTWTPEISMVWKFCERPFVKMALGIVHEDQAPVCAGPLLGGPAWHAPVCASPAWQASLCPGLHWSD